MNGCCCTSAAVRFFYVNKSIVITIQEGLLGFKSPLCPLSQEVTHFLTAIKCSCFRHWLCQPPDSVITSYYLAHCVFVSVYSKHLNVCFHPTAYGMIASFKTILRLKLITQKKSQFYVTTHSLFVAVPPSVKFKWIRPEYIYLEHIITVYQAD